MHDPSCHDPHAHLCSDHSGEGPTVWDLPIPQSLKDEWLRLETWEPALAVRCLEGLARSIPKGQEKPLLDALLVRLACLDPRAAAAMQ